MDMSQKYIRMCADARDILKSRSQDLHDGDFYISEYNPAYNQTPTIHWQSYTYYHDLWLPRLDQLLELSGLDWDLFYHDLVSRYSEYDTAEQAALSQIMYTKFGMKWTGKSWEHNHKGVI